MFVRLRRGFTLIEVMVALTIGSAVVLLVHGAFAATTDLAAGLDRERRTQASRRAAHERLTTTFGSMEIGIPGTTGFEGGPTQTSFSAFIAAQRGGVHEASPRVRLAVEGQWLLLRIGGAPPESLLQAEALTLDYLTSTGAESEWVQSWVSPVTAPVAVRLRLRQADDRADTLFFLIGSRG